MAWETRRNGRRYYYRVRRVNGRVVRDYLGDGLVAEAAAAVDAALRERKRLRRAERAAEAAARRELRADLATLDGLADLLLRATLIAAGYRQHARGQWRKRRDNVVLQECECAASPTAGDATRCPGCEVGE